MKERFFFKVMVALLFLTACFGLRNAAVAQYALDTTVCADEAVSFKTTNPASTTYAWYKSVDGGTTFDLIVGETSDELSLVGITGADAGEYYVFDDVNNDPNLDIQLDVFRLKSPTITGLLSMCEDAATGIVYSTESTWDSWSWSATGGTILGSGDADQETVDWDSPPMGSEQITVEVTDGLITCQVTENVVVNPLPTPPSLSGDIGDALVCAGTSATQITVVYTTDAVSDFVWEIDGDTVSTSVSGSSVTVVWDVPGTGTVSVVYTDPVTGCTASTVLNVDVFPKPAKPVIDVSTLYPWGEYCPHVDFSVKLSNYDPAVVYDWYAVGFNPSLNPIAPISVDDDSAVFNLGGVVVGDYFDNSIYAIATANGCSDTSAVGTVRIYSEIIIQDIRPTSTCPLTDIQVTVTYDGGVFPYEYTWIGQLYKKDGGGVLVDENKVEPPIPPAPYDMTTGECGDTTRVYLTIEDVNGCRVDTVIDVVAKDTATPNFRFFPVDAIIYKDDTCGYDASPELTAEPVPSIQSGGCSPTHGITYYDSAIEVGDCPDETIIYRRWGVFNRCEDTTWRIQLITIKDTTPPVITRGLAIDMPIFTKADCTFDLPDPETTLFRPFVTDNCTQEVRLESEDFEEGDICPNGSKTVTRKWVAVDDCGNYSVDTIFQIFTILDVTPPRFVEFPKDITIYSTEGPGCEYDADPYDVTGFPTANDNCTDSLNIKISYTDLHYNIIVPIVPLCPRHGILRTWRAEDDCGNINLRTQTITIADTIPPVIITENNTDTIIYVGDNCDFDYPGTVAVEFEDNCTPTNRIRIRKLSDEVSVGVDVSVTTVDTITTRERYRVRGRFGRPQWRFRTVTSYERNTIDYSDFPNCGQTIVRKWVAEDLCGNVSDTLYRTFYIIDTIPPVFESFPVDTFVYAEVTDCINVPDITPEALGTPTYSDNCSLEIDLSYVDDTLKYDQCHRFIHRTWTIVDECGNWTDSLQKIEIIDTVKPIFLYQPDDITIYVDANCDYNADPIRVTGYPEAWDNSLEEVIITWEDDTVVGPNNCGWIVTREWTIKDSCDNKDAYTQIITVMDSIPPFFVSRPYSRFAVLYANDTCGYDVDLDATGKPVPQDNCTAEEDIIVYPIDTYLATVPAHTVVAYLTSALSYVPNQYLTTIIADINNAIEAATMPPENCDAKLYMRRFGAEDNCGNVYEDGGWQSFLTAQWFIVVDTTPPTVVAPDTISVCKDDQWAGGYPYFDPAKLDPDITTNQYAYVGMPTITDNCTDMGAANYLGDITATGAELTPNTYGYSDDYSNLPPFQSIDGYIIRTWYAMDDCGNVDSAKQRINVVSNPVVWFARNQVVCEDTPLRLVANIYPPDVDYTYQWIWWGYDGTKAEDLFNDSYILQFDTALPINNYGYLFQFSAYHTPSGCYVSAYDTVQVQASRTMRIYTDAPFDKGEHIICINTPVTLTADVNLWAEPQNMRYQWFRDGVAMPGEIYPVLVDTIDEQHTYQFVMIQEDGTNCNVYSNFITVSVFPAPIGHIAYDFDTICEGGTATLTAYLDNYALTRLAAQSEWLIQWYKDDVAIPYATDETYIASEAGKYWFTAVQLRTGCTAVFPDTMELTVVGIPVAEAIAEVNDAYCLNSQVYLEVGAADVLDITTDTITTRERYRTRFGRWRFRTVTTYEYDTVVSYVPGLNNLSYQWYRNGFEINGATLSHFTDVLTPAGTVTYEVVIQTDVPGCVSELTKVYEIEVIDAPTVAIVGHSLVCDPDSAIIDLTANVLPYSNENYAYQWILNNTILGGETAETYAQYHLTSPDAYDFAVEVTDITTGCVTLSEVYSVHINANPTAIISASATTICDEEAVTFTANVGLDPNMTYQWYINGDSAKDFGADAPVFTTSNIKDGDTVTFQARQVGGTGCGMNSNALIMTVIPRPDAPQLTAAKDTICEGTQVIIGVDNYQQILASFPGDSIVYTWYRNGFEIQDAYGFVFMESPETVQKHLTTYVYNATATTLIGGCTSKSSAVKVITVSQNPSVVVSGDPVVCEEDDVQLYNVNLTANVNDTTGTGYGLTYQWRYDNADIPGANSETYSTNDTARTYPYMYSVRVATEKGCWVLSDPFDVTVYEKPVVFITATEDTICVGGQTTLTANLGDPNVTNLTFLWTNSNGDTLHTSPTYTVSNAKATDTYKVQVTQTTSGCVQTDEKEIVVNPKPDVTLSIPDPQQVCTGGEVKIFATITNGTGTAGGEVYTWYNNNILQQNVISDTLIDYPVVMGNADSTIYTYTVSVKQTASGCASAVSAGVQAIAYKQPTVTVVPQGVTTICKGTTLTLQANVLPVRATSYQWYEDDVLIVGADQDSYEVPSTHDSGTFYFHVEINQHPGCSPTSVKVPVTIVPALQAHITVNRDTICLGGDIQFTANVTPAGNYDYEWTIGTTPLNLNQDVVTTTAFAQGNNTVYLTVKPKYGNNGNCDVTVNKTVRVEAVPQISSITGPTPQRVCDGGEVKLKANVSGGVAGGEVYTWYINNTVKPFYTLDSLTDYPAVAFGADSTVHAYKVFVTQSTSGCISPVSTVVQAIAYKEPTVTIAVQSSYSPIICNGTQITLEANVISKVPAGNVIYYTWYKDNNPTPVQARSSASNTYQVPNNLANGTHNYHVVIDQLPGCAPVSNPFTVTVVPKITGNIVSEVVNLGDSVLCSGGTITLTAVVSNKYVAGDYDCEWAYSTNNGSSYTTIQNGSLSLFGAIQRSNLAAGNYIFRATVSPTNYGHGACDLIMYKNVTVVASPGISLSADTSILCVGGDVTLTANVTFSSPIANSGKYEFDWRKDGVGMNTNAPSVRDYLNTVGVYKYSVRVRQDDYGCISDTFSSVTITVIEQPELTITDKIGLLDICVGGEISLEATITNHNPVYDAVSYSWYYNKNLDAVTGTIDTFTKQINRVGQYDYYAIVTTKGRGCKPAESNHIAYNVVENPSWATVVVTPQEICEGETVFLEAVVQGGVKDNSGNTSGIIKWLTGTTANNITQDVMGGIGGKSYDIPSTTGDVYYKPTYYNFIESNGCHLEDADSIIVKVHERPTAEFISGDSTVVCGNDVNSYADLVVRFTGTPPFTFVLIGSDGTNQQMKSMTNIFTIPVSPTQTTYYYIASLIDNSGCYAFSNTLPVVVYVSHITNVSNLVSTCGEVVAGQNPTARVYFDILSVYPGRPPLADIVFLDPNYTQYNTTAKIINVAGDLNYVEFETPTDPGDYELLLILDDCEYPFTLRVAANNHDKPLVLQRWDDVVVVNNNHETNGGYTFTSFQWYKDGEKIPGATGQYYQEVGGLSGNYSVMLIGTDANGKEVKFMTCEEYFATKSAMLSVRPNPSAVFQSVTIEAGLSEEELKGAVLDIYTILGQHLKRMNIISNTIEIDGFAVPGTYVGRITTGTQEIKSVKIVVVN